MNNQISDKLILCHLPVQIQRLFHKESLVNIYIYLVWDIESAFALLVTQTQLVSSCKIRNIKCMFDFVSLKVEPWARNSLRCCDGTWYIGPVGYNVMQNTFRILQLPALTGSNHNSSVCLFTCVCYYKRWFSIIYI